MIILHPVKTNALRAHCKIGLEKISDRHKLSKKFKKSCLHVDKDNYKEGRHEVQKLIRTKKKADFASKLTENIGNPKELWNCLKSLGLKLESSISNIVLKTINLLTLMLKI